MIAEEQDRTVARLRHELGSVDVRTHGDHVDRVLRHVHNRRKAQKRQRMQVLTAMAVVLVALTGAFVVVLRTPDPTNQVAAQPVIDWPLRGDLAGDTGLLSRAEKVWREAQDLADKPIRPLYATRSPHGEANMILVVLASTGPDGSPRVAFVTTPTTIRREPDATKLMLRAVTTVEPNQRAIGFIAATASTQDQKGLSASGVAFALGAPNSTNLKVRSSVLDDAYVAASVVHGGGLWQLLETGVGAWNSGVEASLAGTTPTLVQLAAGVDDVDVAPVSLITDPNGLRAEGTDVRSGDMIATPTGVLGVVTGPNGLVDTRLTSLNSAGIVRTAISKVPGVLSDQTTFTPTGPVRPGEIAPGNRVVLTDREREELVFTIGTLTSTKDGWLLDRAATPDTTTAMRVGKR
ncbi:MAG: hypothetical protein M3548_21555 [Actinomycetota bacterium]|nr:hypothetical protein [Actinomycetota bacterium]